MGYHKAKSAPISVLTDKTCVRFVPRVSNQKFLMRYFISKSRFRAKLCCYTHSLKTTFFENLTIQSVIDVNVVVMPSKWNS